MVFKLELEVQYLLRSLEFQSMSCRIDKRTPQSLSAGTQQGI